MKQTLFPNRDGKQFAVFMTISTLLFWSYWAYKKGLGNTPVYLFVCLVTIWLFFTYKELCLIDGKITIRYPLRPFFRHITLNLKKIKKTRYGLISSGRVYQHFSIRTIQFPWIIEFRITGINEIDAFKHKIKSHSQIKLEQDSKNRTIRLSE